MQRKMPVGFTIAGIVAGLILLAVIIRGYSRRIAGEEAAREQHELQRLSDSTESVRRQLHYGKPDSTAKKTEKQVQNKR